MKKLLLLCFMLSGCAQIQQQQASEITKKESLSINQYINDSGPLLKSGELTYSDFYKHVFDMLSTSHLTDRGYMMQMATEAIENANNLESGKITKEQFELQKMKITAKITSHQDEANRESQINAQNQDAQNQANSQAAYANYLRLQSLQKQSQPVYQSPQIQQPIRTNCYSNAGYTNCTTQ